MGRDIYPRAARVMSLALGCHLAGLSALFNRDRFVSDSVREQFGGSRLALNTVARKWSTFSFST